MVFRSDQLLRSRKQKEKVEPPLPSLPPLLLPLLPLLRPLPRCRSCHLRCRRHRRAPRNGSAAAREHTHQYERRPIAATVPHQAVSPRASPKFHSIGLLLACCGAQPVFLSHLRSSASPAPALDDFTSWSKSGGSRWRLVGKNRRRFLAGVEEVDSRLHPRPAPPRRALRVAAALPALPPAPPYARWARVSVADDAARHPAWIWWQRRNCAAFGASFMGSRLAARIYQNLWRPLPHLGSRPAFASQASLVKPSWCWLDSSTWRGPGSTALRPWCADGTPGARRRALGRLQTFH